MSYKNLGFGLGLRPDHFNDIISHPKKVDWFEALTENYMGLPDCGQSSLLESLLTIRKDYPVVFHCVSTNIGGVDTLDHSFLMELKELAQIVQPEWISDHLCWTGSDQISSHELLPLPYTREAVEVVSENIHQVQEILNQRFMIENTSSYMSFKQSEMTEWEFINEITQKTGCGLLLDVNNVYVSSQNHNYNPNDFIDGINLQHVGQIHLAGHQVEENGLVVDTHDQPVCNDVFNLLAYTMKKLNAVSIMVEWDDNLPSYNDYVAELEKAKKIVLEAQK